MANEKILRQVQEELQKGDRPAARELLTNLLRSDQTDPNIWLWMSAAVESRQERIFCLENVLKLDPANELAKRGLALARGLPPGEEPPVKPLVRRRWTLTDVQVEAAPKTFLGRLWANPLLRLGLLAAMALVLIAVIGGLVWETRRPETPVVFITLTLHPSETATSTPTATATPKIRTATPVIKGATPLSALLQQTYTPTPLYVNTPHAITEAYRIALRALEAGDLPRYLTNIQQASRENPTAPDLKYLVGEGFRLTGAYDEAINAYNESIAIDNRFAPPYLGRALATLARQPDAGVQKDLDKAISLDPNFAQAYRERAAYAIRQDQLAAAEQDIQALEQLTPGSPWPPLLRAQLYLAQGLPAQALQAAQQANQRDITLLPAYLALAQCYLKLEQPEEAQRAAELYMAYPENQASVLGWLVLGEARWKNGDQQNALAALDEAQAQGSQSIDLYIYRGQILVAMGRAQDAINAFAEGYRLDARNFEVNLGLGEALYSAKRYIDAIQQFQATERLALTDTQKAPVYYFRARAIDEGGNPRQAQADYLALLALPKAVVPPAWLEYAANRMAVLNPPTATPTATATPRPSATFSPTPTIRPSITMTPSKTVPPSATPTPTRTPTSQKPGGTPSATPTKKP